jgi:hypothetical protein
MRAFVLHTTAGDLYLAFGEDAVQAAATLPDSVPPESVGVGGSYHLDKPIDLRRLWPYFTCNPIKTESK